MSNNDPISTSVPETILVVEDKVLERVAISEYLRHCGYHVIEAASADEALILLNKNHIHIDTVFSIVEMSGSMDGFGLAQWIRANKPGMDIILTSDINNAAHKAGELCEHGPHLAKPYEPNVLVDLIKRLKASKNK